MKSKFRKINWLILSVLVLILGTGVFSTSARATGITATMSTDRATGVCTYKITGLDAAEHKNLTLQVEDTTDHNMTLVRNYDLSTEDLSDGTYTGSFSLEDLSFRYASYEVSVLVNNETYAMGTCDFSIHQNKVDLSMNGVSGSATRTVYVNSTEAKDGVLVPGSGNKVAVFAWQNGKSESTAKQIGDSKSIAGKSLNWSVNITTAGKAYGIWNAKLVLTNDHISSGVTLATTTYKVMPSSTSFAVKKSASLEKKKSFQIELKGLKNAYGVQKVAFRIYDSKNSKVATVTATKKSSTYYATVSLKTLKYKLDQYTVKAVITDTAGTAKLLENTTVADERASGGTLTITKKTNATTVFRTANAYIPGNIKKIQYVIYKLNGSSKKKVDSLKAALSGKKYSAVAKNTATGKYTVYVYGYTSWNKKVLLNKKNYSLTKKNLGKQGWYYEKYGGKKYKFYYKNNEKVTDLTKILKISKKSKKRFYIEVNRAACVVTIYMYNNDTKKFDIPVKTCTVCVGRDVSTNAGAGSLNIKSSFTPIGNYSICSNGTAVRYSLKPMHEPDGSVVYSRWCTHIVGNVYFHAIAVNSDTHYGLSSYKMNLLGSPASAGCIRMAVADAKWIYDYMPTGTKVKIVVGSKSKPGPLGKIALPKSRSVNYDPTDPAVPDSRKKKDYKAKKITGYLTKSGKRVGY